MDINRKGIAPMDDDMLNIVTGGVSPDDLLWKQAEMMARADGRKIGLANEKFSSDFCPCHYRFKWAKSDRAINSANRTTKGYTDIKCYQCGKIDLGSIF